MKLRVNLRVNLRLLSELETFLGIKIKVKSNIFLLKTRFAYGNFEL